MSGITGSTRNAARLRDSDRIVMAARERMNELLADYSLPRDTPVSGAFDPALMGGIEAGWRAQLSTAEKPPAARDNWRSTAFISKCGGTAMAIGAPSNSKASASAFS